MKILFYLGLLGLLAYEVLNVYFIMPMPGSQQMDSIAAAYFLYHWRWLFRGVLFVLLVAGFLKGKWKRRWMAFIPVLLIGPLIWFLNFRMSADHMFRQPGELIFSDAAGNKVDSNRLVVGVFMGGKAKAYPIQFIGYHHIVQDTVGDTPVLVTYCTVCRTGRVYDPRINGRLETFRLVGMDHFNAMVEDETTKSWWRQATGEAVAGTLKNAKLRELFCTQTTLAEWLKLHPASLVMQRDPALKGGNPQKSLNYETGKSRDALTGTDSLSWKDKSWILGVREGNVSKAYDWNLLKANRMIKDRIGERDVVLVLAGDNTSFFGVEIPEQNSSVHLSNDTIIYNGRHYYIDGVGIDTAYSLKKIPVYQEFWHSWRTFHPGTQTYK